MHMMHEWYLVTGQTVNLISILNTIELFEHIYSIIFARILPKCGILPNGTNLAVGSG